MARKPRGLPSETLQRVIALKEANWSWIKIQKEVGIDRRTAKRAYEDWQRSKSTQELKAARMATAEAEFRNHLHYLVALAGALAQTIGVPSEQSVATPAAEVINRMWETSRLGDCTAYGVPYIIANPETRNLLLASLKAHTSAKVRWESLQEWERAWDDCRSTSEELRKEVSGVVHNVLEQNNLLAKISKHSKKEAEEQQLVRWLIHLAWEQILHPVDPKELSIVEVEVLGERRSRLLLGKERLVTSVILDTDLCEQLAQVSRRAAESVLKLPRVEDIKRLIKTAGGAVTELRQNLNPLLLGPIILNTHCDLCPA